MNNSNNMSFRDAVALTFIQHCFDGGQSREQAAAECYELADIFIAARDKGNNNNNNKQASDENDEYLYVIEEWDSKSKTYRFVHGESTFHDIIPWWNNIIKNRRRGAGHTAYRLYSLKYNETIYIK
jgi:hypothetical protein